jgi:hypothetical protein
MTNDDGRMSWNASNCGVFCALPSRGILGGIVLYRFGRPRARASQGVARVAGERKSRPPAVERYRGHFPTGPRRGMIERMDRGDYGAITRPPGP